MRNKKFEVKIQKAFGKPALSITNNGYQWNSLIIQNAEYEIPLIIRALNRYLSPNKPVEPTAKNEPIKDLSHNISFNDGMDD